MDLGAARERIANNAGAAVTGHARPPGALNDLPALIVLDPIDVTYHTAASNRHTATMPVRIVVSRTVEQDGTAELDDLVSYPQIPATLEAIDPAGDWVQLAVTEMADSYFDFAEAGNTVGLAADLLVTIIFTT